MLMHYVVRVYKCRREYAYTVHIMHSYICLSNILHCWTQLPVCPHGRTVKCTADIAVTYRYCTLWTRIRDSMLPRATLQSLAHLFDRAVGSA
jgi:hypothetical protein